MACEFYLKKPVGYNFFFNTVRKKKKIILHNVPEHEAQSSCPIGIFQTTVPVESLGVL